MHPTQRLADAAPSHFALLGLPERYAVELRELEDAFHRMSRLVHPDRFAGATPAERRLAVQRTTLLNDAYRTLRDPLRRAEYLLAREGLARGEERAAQDPDLLVAVMEWRERVQELRPRVHEGAPGALDDLRDLRAEIQGKLRALGEAIEHHFQRYDGGARGPDLAELAATLDKVRYYAGIKAELDQIALQARQLA